MKKAIGYFLMAPFRSFWVGEQLRNEENLSALCWWAVAFILLALAGMGLYMRPFYLPGYAGLNLSLLNFDTFTLLLGPIGVAFFVRVLINRFGYAFMEGKELFVLALYAYLPMLIGCCYYLYAIHQIKLPLLPNEDLGLEIANYVMIAGDVWTLLTMALLNKKFKRIGWAPTLFATLAATALYVLAMNVLVGKIAAIGT